MMFGLAVITLLGAFTKEQRAWIKKRDEENSIRGNQGACQFPESHNCNGDMEIQVHHIIPQRYARDRGINPDFAENGLTLCSNSHIGEIRPGEPGIHPDMYEARIQYVHDRNSFKKAFEERQRKIASRQIYWNDKWDRLLTVLGIRNTQRFVRQHPNEPFLLSPQSRRRNQNERKQISQRRK